MKLEISALEARLLAARHRSTDHRWLLAASLAACGAREDVIQDCQRQLDRWADELRSTGSAGDGARRQVEALFDFLHHRVLRGDYHVDATDLALAFRGAGYNCVSSSILFICLAGRLGISVRAAESPGHVFCVIPLPDGQLDVETTCRQWFNVIDDPAQRHAAVEHILGRRPPSSVASARREHSAAGLVALVYYNRGVDLLRRRKYAEALSCNLKALRLDPASSAAHGNLLATLNNWSVDCYERGEFSRAIGLLRHGLAMAPDHAPFRSNYVAIHQRWVDDLSRAGRCDEALAHLTAAQETLPGESYFQAAIADLLQRTSVGIESDGGAGSYAADGVR